MSEAAQGKFCWSSNDGFFGNCNFATREDAIAAAIRELNAGEKFWTGEQWPFVPEVRACNVFDQLACEASDEAGEAAEDWLFRVPKDEEAELTAALTAAFNAWAEKHGYTPDFFGVQHIEEHATPAATEVPA